MRKKITAVLLAGAFALSVPAAALGVTGNPNAGKSGNFKGGSQVCKKDAADKKCPPQND